jgi:cell pole-organizing protein PopZ
MSGPQSKPADGQPDRALPVGGQSADAPAGGTDPSMEDILASIRRILSEEDVPLPPPATTPPEAADQEPDVLLLDRSMLVADAPPPVPAPPGVGRIDRTVTDATVFETTRAPVAPVEPMPVEATSAGRTEEAEDLVGPEPIEVPVEPERGVPAATTSQSESSAMSASMSSAGLASAETADAAAGSVSNLVRALTSDRSAQVHSGGPTIADLVREELRPMLKAWLDSNLPPLVERLVRAEIERVISRAAL